MTLILSLGNRDHLIQVSERRISALGKVISEETNKAGVFGCINGRCAYGFSGLAHAPGFRTSEWLARALHDSAPPEFTIGHAIQRLRERATHDFRTLPSLRRLRPMDKRLTVMFSGFLWATDPPALFLNLLTNFENAVEGSYSGSAWDEFRLLIFVEPQPLADNAVVMYRIGRWPATTPGDAQPLHRLLTERRPHRAVVSKAVDTIRSVAERSAAGKTVGKQITAITIWPDPSRQAQFGYHSEGLARTYPIPDMVFETSDELRTVAIDGSFQLTDADGPAPFIVPKVRPNQPCPCRSGKKYKYCHGESEERRARRGGVSVQLRVIPEPSRSAPTDVATPVLPRKEGWEFDLTRKPSG